jgi:hypothetical protein
MFIYDIIKVSPTLWRRSGIKITLTEIYQQNKKCEAGTIPELMQ